MTRKPDDSSDRRRLDARYRLTRGVNAARLRMEARRAVAPGGVVLVASIGGLLLLGFLLTHISQTFGKQTETVRFATPSTFGIFEGFDEVRFRGVPAGTITKIEHRGSQLVIVARIRKSFGPIYKDARAEVRPITPLNDEYLNIVDPGTANAGQADESVPLPQSQTTTSVSVPEVLDTFGANQRLYFHTLLDQLGNGMADRGVSLRAAFAAAVPLIQGAGRLTEQLAIRDDATKRLIHNASLLTRELAFRQAALRTLAVQGSKTLATLRDGSPDLDATLRELGPTFGELQSSLASVRGVLGDVDTGLRSLTPVAERLPGGLGALRSLSATLTPTLESLRTPIRQITPFVTSAAPVARDARDSSRLLRRQVPLLDKITSDLVACEPGVIGFFQWNASLSKFGDANAPAPRGTAALGVPAVGLPGEPLRPFHQSCAPGPIARGVITSKDEH